MPLVPVEAFHPNIFIKEELEAREWSIDDLVRRMPGDYGINHLAIDMYLDLGADEPNMRLGDMAAEIARAFGVSDEFFTNLEKTWFDHPTTKARLLKELH